MNTIPHIPVLRQEVLDVFSTLNDGIFIDCTLGYGGHSQAILEAHPNITVVGIDKDPTAREFSQQRLNPFNNRFRCEAGAFSEIITRYCDQNIVGILADIGVSSLQLDERMRGFSFDSPVLDMRMSGEGMSAMEVVNRYNPLELERIFRDYGEEKLAKKAAYAIAQEREKNPFHSGEQLAHFLERIIPKSGKIHPATRIFQAIRIEVNDELGELERLLMHVSRFSHPLRLAIISFHSLEDRIVKQTFKDWSHSCICPPEAYRCLCGNNHEKGKIITKKPIEATDAENKINPRARSAKMRVFELKGQ